MNYLHVVIISIAVSVITTRIYLEFIKSDLGKQIIEALVERIRRI